MSTVGLASAAGEPSRPSRGSSSWQITDRTTFGFRLVAPADATPKLDISCQGEDYDLAPPRRCSRVAKR